jgi:pyruvate ferredoxin oxidoreductase delta subunit
MEKTMSSKFDASKVRDDAYFPLAVPVKGAGGLTGTWRTTRPVLDHEKCIGCDICWLYCPDGVIARGTQEIDLDYCKGCGVCEKECPVDAIKMVVEE